MQDMMTAAFWRDIEEGNQPDNGDAIEIAKTYERAYQQGWRDADQHPQWIPVEERLPEKDDDYLVLDCKRRVVAAFDPSDKTWWESDGNCIVSVFPTHWMPIVSPRKEDKE